MNSSKNNEGVRKSQHNQDGGDYVLGVGKVSSRSIPHVSWLEVEDIETDYSRRSFSGLNEGELIGFCIVSVSEFGV